VAPDRVDHRLGFAIEPRPGDQISRRPMTDPLSFVTHRVTKDRGL
jgi:hypothetical protein